MTNALGKYFPPEHIRKHPKDSFGVEVEVEFSDRYLEPPIVKGWRKEHDGSLRGNAVEYVTTGVKDLDKTLDSIDRLYGRIGDKINNSFRAGVHVHLNFLKNTDEELMHFIILYYIVEPVLLKYCGDSRNGNLFCLPFDQVENSVIRLLNIGSVALMLRALDQDRYKYASLNLCSLVKYGSVESRLLQTPTDVNNITNWVKLLNAIKDYACSNEMKTLAQDFSIEGNRGFVKKVLGDLFFEVDPEVYVQVNDNFWALQGVMFNFLKKKKSSKPKLKDAYNFAEEAFLRRGRAEDIRMFENVILRDNGEF